MDKLRAAPWQTRAAEDSLAGQLLGRLRRSIGRSCRVTLPAGVLRRGAEEALEEAEKEDQQQAEGEAEEAEEARVLIGDGGSVCNLPLPMLLARGVRRCLCLVNVGELLPTKEVWDPTVSELPPEDVPFCEDLAALFGVLPASLNPSKDLSNAQCFERKGFTPLVAALQASVAAAHKTISRMPLPLQLLHAAPACMQEQLPQDISMQDHVTSLTRFLLRTWSLAPPR